MASAHPFEDPEQLLTDRAWLVRLAFELLGDRDEAEDAAQEVQLRALGATVGRGRERSWLARVVRNLALRWRARREWREGWERNAATPAPPASGCDLAARVEAQRAVAEAVLALDERDRAVILRRFFQDQKPSEIARALGVPVETVRTRTKRALARLRARLDARHGGREAWSAALLPWVGAGVVGSGTKVAAAAAVLVAAALVVVPPLLSSGPLLPTRAAAVHRAAGAATTTPASERSEGDRPAAPIDSTRTRDLVARGGIVRIVDPEQRAIVGAHLFTGSRERAEEIATSDSSGVARLPDAIGATWLMVTARGCRMAERQLTAPRPSETTIVLAPGVMLSGTIVAADGSGHRGGLSVVAIPASRPFSPDHVAAICSGRAPGPVATSDERGEFAIDGLDPSDSYALVAGGRGCVSRRIETFQPGRGEVVVTVGFLYGVDLDIRQNDGTPLPGSPGIGPPIADDARCDDTVDDPLRPIVAALPSAPSPGDRHRYRILHVVDSDAFDQVGPFAHSIAEAGFEPRTAEVYLPRVVDALPVAEVGLEPLPELKLGSLFVEILGETAAVAAGAAGTLGTLTLQPFDVAYGRSLEIPLEAGRGARRRFDGVPCCSRICTWWPPDGGASQGIYMARGGRDSVALRDVAFLDGTATIVVDLRRYGDVEFEIRNRDGSPRRDELTLRLERIASADGIAQGRNESQLSPSFWPVPVTLADSPYVLRVLPPGRYRATEYGMAARRRSMPPNSDPQSSAEFEIVAGAVSRCPLTLDE